MHPCSAALWGARLLFLLFAVWGAWAEERQCSVDSECGYREECRKAVVHGVLAAVKTCQCHKYVFADGHEPRCIAHNWRTVVATIVMTVAYLAFIAAQTQYRVAYIEHMTDPPLRPGETRFKRALSLRTFFLAFSTLAASSTFLFCGGCILTIYAPVSTKFWYHNPLSPIQLGSSLHAFGARGAFMVVVCIWVRVAAKLHDPASSTKKALYQLAFALDGSGIGLYLAIFFALPTGVVVIYFLLQGSWDHAFQCGVLFVACALILTSLAAKLLVARQMHRYQIEQNGPTAAPSTCAAFFRYPRPNGPGQRSAAAVGVTDPEEGAPPEKHGVLREREMRMVRERQESLQGDVVASVSARSLMSSYFSSDACLIEEELRPSPLPALASHDQGEVKTDPTAEEEDSGTPYQTQSGTSQSQDISGAAFIELRVRIIQWEAATLGKRVILSAAVGMVTFLLAMPYGPWRYSYLMQIIGVCLCGMGLLLANVNCLCYISPAVRRNVRRWVNGTNPFLLCIGVLLWKPHTQLSARGRE